MSDSESNYQKVRRFYDHAARKKDNNLISSRRKTRIFHLRNFNNWTKSIFISYYLHKISTKKSRVRVLDLCCGKGGDQLKFLQNMVDFVTFVDLSSDSIAICRQRYEQLCRRKRLVYKANFFVANCSRDHLEKTIPEFGSYHLVSCQFSLHYSFESLSEARRILSNISHALQDNGYFIASIPNAYEIVRRAKSAFTSDSKENKETKEIKFGNSIYSLSFPPTSFSVSSTTVNGKTLEKLHFPLFGAQYSFYLDGVVDCPEFLLYPPLLDQIAAEYNLHPVKKPISFADHFYDAVTNLTTPEDPVELLKRMEALETWYNDSEDYQTNGEYTHVLDRLQSDCKYSHCIGTLSKSDWEVATMYLLVAYQKRIQQK